MFQEVRLIILFMIVCVTVNKTNFKTHYAYKTAEKSLHSQWKIHRTPVISSHLYKLYLRIKLVVDTSATYVSHCWENIFWWWMVCMTVIWLPYCHETFQQLFLHSCTQVIQARRMLISHSLQIKELSRSRINSVGCLLHLDLLYQHSLILNSFL